MLTTLWDRLWIIKGRKSEIGKTIHILSQSIQIKRKEMMTNLCKIYN